MPVRRSNTRTKYRTPIIETCLVMNVNAGDYTVDAWAEMSGRRYLDIPFMQPYAHYMNGEGIYFMPEVGAPCWVCSPSEGDKPAFVMGFGSAYDSDGTYKNLKRGLNPGDIFLGTRDDNHVILRRGGVLQLGGGPLTQRMYLPIGNWIRDFCASYRMDTVGGVVEWKVHPVDESVYGDSMTTYLFQAKDKATDESAVVQIIAGHDEVDEDLAYSVSIRSGGGSDDGDVAVLKVKKTGEVSWEVDGPYSVTSKGDVSLVSSEGNVVIQSSSGYAEMLGKTAVNLKSEAGIVAECATGSQVQLGGPGAVHPAADGTVVDQQLAALAAVFSGWVVTPADGGLALKTALTALLASGWPSSVGATKVTVE